MERPATGFFKGTPASNMASVALNVDRGRGRGVVVVSGEEGGEGRGGESLGGGE